MDILDIHEIKVGDIVTAPNVGNLSDFVTAGKEYKITKLSPPAMFTIIDDFGKPINCIYFYPCEYLNGAYWKKK